MYKFQNSHSSWTQNHLSGKYGRFNVHALPLDTMYMEIVHVYDLLFIKSLFFQTVNH